MMMQLKVIVCKKIPDSEHTATACAWTAKFCVLMRLTKKNGTNILHVIYIPRNEIKQNKRMFNVVYFSEKNSMFTLY